MDKACSGKSSCEYYVPQPDLYNIRCSDEGTSLYLSAIYGCIEGKNFSYAHSQNTISFEYIGLFLSQFHSNVNDILLPKPQRLPLPLGILFGDSVTMDLQ